MNHEPKATNPYVGLRPFEQEDSLYFFGRREQTAELLEQLAPTHFLAVVGSSGCGKSSLIRAGFIPALLGGFLVEERDAWQIAIMKPGDAPLRNLAAALCQAFDKAPSDAAIADLHGAIIADHIQAAISYLSLRLGARTNLLLLIDQFEEVFSFRGTGEEEQTVQEEEEQTVQLGRQQRREHARRRAEADDFVDLMLGLKSSNHLPVYTVLTMRTDFLGDCDLFYGLPEAMNESRYLVPRLTRQQLHQAMEGPALLSGTSLTPRLLDHLLNQLGDRADRLPVLQHALLRTWDIWRREAQAGPMDFQHYEAAGTLRQALSQHADEALRPHDLDDLDTTAKIFKCLIDTDPHHRRVRRPARLSELAAVTGQSPQAVRAILERFREGGRNFLVISASAEPDDQRIDVSHESLIRQWDRLKLWVDEERVSRDQFLDLVHLGRGYRLGKRALLRDPDLQTALRWRATYQPTAAWAKRYCTNNDDFDVAVQYLDQSRKRRRLRRYLLGLTAIMLVLVPILYDVFQNIRYHHFSLSAKQGILGNVEVYRGNPMAWDILNIRRYIAETDYQRWQIEPSRLFNKERITDYNQMNMELIDTFKPVEKPKAYWKSGDIDGAFSAILSATEEYPERTQDIIGVISDFRSLETSKKLKDLLNNNLADMHGTIMDVMALLFPNTTTIDMLLHNIRIKAYPAEVRRVMSEILERISHNDFFDGNINNIIKPYLVLLLDDQLDDQSKEEENRVRLIAARILMWLGDQRGVEELISLAKDALSHTSDDQSLIGAEALEALTGNRNEEVVAFLGSQLQLDENRALRIRRRIIDVLAQIGDDDSVPIRQKSDVIKMLRDLIDDDSVPIRQKAVQALGRTGTPTALRDLFDRLHHDRRRRDREEEDEQPVRRNIVEALGWLMNNSGDHKGDNTNNTIHEYLLKDLLQEFNADFKNPMVRIATAVLGRTGNATTYEMLMDRTNNLHKIIIIDALEALDDIRAIDYLNNLLKEETSNNSEIKQRIATALGRLGDASAVTHLQSALSTSQERGPDANTGKMRLTVVGTLGRLGHKGALESLQKMVSQQGVDKQNILYLSALVALGRLGDVGVVDDLITGLQQGDSLIRWGDLEAMARASAANSIRRRLLSESGEEGSARQVAVEVLGAFDSIRPLNLLLSRLSDGSILVQRGAARALGHLGGGDIRAVDLLIAHLGDGDSGVRQNAAAALGQLGHPKAVAPLIALLQDSQGDVRQAAAEALGRLGNDRALPPLLSGFKGGQKRRKDGVEDARRAALLAYAKIGRKSAPEQTAGELRAVFNNNDEHKRIRLAAAVALLELQSLTPPDAEIMQQFRAAVEVYADGSQSINNRRELSEMLGEFPSEPGRQILLQLLKDTNLNVLENAIKSLGQFKAQDILPVLHRYLEDKNFRLQKAAAEALAAIASAVSIDALVASLNVSAEVSIPTRLTCLQALYNIANNPETGHDGRDKIIREMLKAVEKDEAILGIRTYKLLGDLQARQALGALQKRLKEVVVCQHEWRSQRDALEKPAQTEQALSKCAGFNPPLTLALAYNIARTLAFELAYNIARIDPERDPEWSGLRLLDHDLASVRHGAWQGLGKVGNVALIEQLSQKLKTNDQSWFQKLWGSANPFFRHAAYRAIDHILLRLEAAGDVQDLDMLKRLVPGQDDALYQPKESLEQGICRRVQWTIEQLAAKTAQGALGRASTQSEVCTPATARTGLTGPRASPWP